MVTIVRTGRKMKPFSQDLRVRRRISHNNSVLCGTICVCTPFPKKYSFFCESMHAECPSDPEWCNRTRLHALKARVARQLNVGRSKIRDPSEETKANHYESSRRQNSITSAVSTSSRRLSNFKINPSLCDREDSGETNLRFSLQTRTRYDDVCLLGSI